MLIPPTRPGKCLLVDDSIIDVQMPGMSGLELAELTEPSDAGRPAETR